MFNECPNLFNLTINKQGNTVKVGLSVHDHRSNCDPFYEVQGHLDCYEKQEILFEGIDDILCTIREMERCVQQ